MIMTKCNAAFHTLLYNSAKTIICIGIDKWPKKMSSMDVPALSNNATIFKRVGGDLNLLLHTHVNFHRG